jgi:hypothetical protein
MRPRSSYSLLAEVNRFPGILPPSKNPALRLNLLQICHSQNHIDARQSDDHHAGPLPIWRWIQSLANLVWQD